jgi:hypothetical protein
MGGMAGMRGMVTQQRKQCAKPEVQLTHECELCAPTTFCLVRRNERILR